MKTRTAEVVGLRLRCPKSNRVVVVDRDSYDIGPFIDAAHAEYRIDCKCGQRHTVKTKPHELPEKG